MMIIDQILQFTRRMYPTGRAFRINLDSFLYKLHHGLAVSEARAYADVLSTLDSAIPDNNNFSAGDARQWEHRLGLISNDAVSLANRKAAIIRKMNHPGTTPAQENYLFIEKQLRDAGFNVRVYENIFPDGMGGTMTKTPEEVSGIGDQDVQYADGQYGDFQYGGGTSDIVANYIDEEIDRMFNIGGNLRFTFFIGGSYLGSVAVIDEDRKEEFRQLILRTKPQNMVAFLFVEYADLPDEGGGGGDDEGIFAPEFDESFS